MSRGDVILVGFPYTPDCRIGLAAGLDAVLRLLRMPE
jgi:hypothetical protein